MFIKSNAGKGHIRHSAMYPPSETMSFLQAGNIPVALFYIALELTTEVDLALTDRRDARDLADIVLFQFVDHRAQCLFGRSLMLAEAHSLVNAGVLFRRKAHQNHVNQL